jgi:hypothetical protein
MGVISLAAAAAIFGGLSALTTISTLKASPVGLVRAEMSAPVAVAMKPPVRLRPAVYDEPSAGSYSSRERAVLTALIKQLRQCGEHVNCLDKTDPLIRRQN